MHGLPECWVGGYHHHHHHDHQYNGETLHTSDVERTRIYAITYRKQKEGQ